MKNIKNIHVTTLASRGETKDTTSEQINALANETMNLLKNIYMEAELGSVLADAQKKFDFYIKNDFSSNEKKKSLHVTLLHVMNFTLI